LISTCFAAYCPSAQDLYPAHCFIEYRSGVKLSSIFINVNETLNLTAIFNKVSQDPRAVAEKFDYIDIINNKLVEIPENGLGKLSFKTISIYNISSLKRIHSNAFSHQSNYASILLIRATNIISGSAPYNFYDLANSFTNLTQFDYWGKIGTLEEKLNFQKLSTISLRVDGTKEAHSLI